MSNESNEEELKSPCVVPAETTPLEFLKMVMCGAVDPTEAQLKAAIAAARYTNPTASSLGKKELRKAAAAEVSKGKFAPTAPPRLVVSNG